MKTLKDRSENIKIKSNLVSFLYLLMQDEIAFGKLEKIMQEIENDNNEEISYTNGYIANYALDLSNRLKD